MENPESNELNLNAQGQRMPKGWDPDGAMRSLLEERNAFATDEATQARQLMRQALPVAVAGVVQLALYGETEKMRFDAQKYLIDRNLGGVTKEGDIAGSSLDPIEALQAKCVAYVEATGGL